MLEHDLFRKPGPTPDHVRGRPFRDSCSSDPDSALWVQRATGIIKACKFSSASEVHMRSVRKVCELAKWNSEPRPAGISRLQPVRRQTKVPSEPRSPRSVAPASIKNKIFSGVPYACRRSDPAIP